MGERNKRIRSIEALPRYREELREFLGRLIERYRPACAILHGSFARGDWDEYSDLDLVVIGGSLPTVRDERLAAIAAIKQFGVPISVFWYTAEDWERGLRRAHVTPCEAMEFGFPIHGKEFFRKMRRIFLAMKREGLERTEVSWRLPSHLAARL
jgi:predicted nucleotidyltransferase